MWAFGTSNQGLGLSESRFWALTLREFEALKKVYVIARGGQKAWDDIKYPFGKQTPKEKITAINAFVQRLKATRGA